MEPWGVESLTRPPDPKSKTPHIFLRARNDAETLLFLKFKDLIRRDNESYSDVFLPIIEARVQTDNPQLKFVQHGENLILNKTVLPEQKHYGPKTEPCPSCKGAGCSDCGGHGTVLVE